MTAWSGDPDPAAVLAIEHRTFADLIFVLHNFKEFRATFDAKGRPTTALAGSIPALVGAGEVGLNVQLVLGTGDCDLRGWVPCGRAGEDGHSRYRCDRERA